MPTQTYENFDLLIERTANGYRARASSSVAGQATVDWTLPFSAAEQAAIVAANWSTRAGRHFAAIGANQPSAPPLDARTFGDRLFAAVFQNDVRTCLTNSLVITGQNNRGLRIRLRLNDAPELAALPWEYLRGPAPYDFFALSAQTPLVRYLDLLQGEPLLQASVPLRILVVLSDPKDVAKLDVESEWERLQTALADLQTRGIIALERLAGATLDSLQRRLRQTDAPVHILHFIGHGDYDEKQRTGGLLWEDAAHYSRFVSADILATLLYDHPSLRLAFLNACEGARSGPADLFAGVAQTLVQKRLPAVIAMQYSITDPAAIHVAHEFYQAIAAGYPVDAALAEARKALYREGNQLEWGTPVLFMRAADGVLWQKQVNKGEKMTEKKDSGNQRINTGGGAFIGGGVNTGGGDFVGRDKVVRGDEVRGNKITGDVITATFGAGAKNIAVGENIRQTITETVGPPTPDDKKIIEAQFQRVLDALNAPTIDPRKAGRAEGNLETLKEELTKTGADEMPNASTITRVGDWLLDNVPELTQALTELFGMPAVGRVIAKAGDSAVAWLRRRFG